MLENLKNLVEENAGDAIVNNPAIPNERNGEAVSAASGSIVDVLKEHLSSGNFGDVTDLFQGGVDGNPVVNQIKSAFAGKLQNMNVDSETAQNTSSSLIPNVLSQLVNKTNDPNNSQFNLQDMLKQFGGDDGKFDVGDVMNLFKGKGGGIGDVLKGLF
ncbi:hypothetical protein GS399_00385 [Pedobacter sp. HMF7647]|uniref:DUF937 domain-containing protein n=1 Tax=Hufsiella arboris TaxID=2695275 RepID=A0A7K1Y4W2_9SPHI|nr:hypothetical protein [Hufsiella arboris]MXV49411.1 hypothetical protein [Hufsiella arboris]